MNMKLTANTGTWIIKFNLFIKIYTTNTDTPVPGRELRNCFSRGHVC